MSNTLHLGLLEAVCTNATLMHSFFIYGLHSWFCDLPPDACMCSWPEQAQGWRLGEAGLVAVGEVLISHPLQAPAWSPNHPMQALPLLNRYEG